jgi:hypothetical protein
MHHFNQVTENINVLRENLSNQGFAFLRSHANLDACEFVKAFIDHYPNRDAEINYSGTEKRIWDAHAKEPIIQEFAALSDQVIGAVFNFKVNVKTVLAYSNFPIPAEESLINGRWHLDSLRRQYKLFCFLTRTEDQTGPLEILPGTHRIVFKLRAVAQGKYLSLWNLNKKMRAYQSLNDRWIETQCRNVGGSVPLLCDAGSLILVDTSAIHRARPCIEGHRYALTSYYDHL